MARTRTWYDPVTATDGDEPVALRAAYVRRVEAAGAEQRERARQLVGYWSPVTGELWSEELLRELWLQNMVRAGFAQGATLGERMTPPLGGWPLSRREAEHPPLHAVRAYLVKAEGARLSRAES